MTPLNTIIEEEKDKIFCKYDFGYMDGTTVGVIEDLNNDLDTAMQRAYEAGREERDTYWKERVRKIYLKILKKARKTDYADTTEYDECAELLKPLLDNLK